MKYISFAIHGFGTIAKTHMVALKAMPIIKKLPFTPKLDTLITRHPKENGIQAKSIGFRHVTDRIEDAAASAEVDVIDVCTPNALHGESIAAAGKFGKALYLEKPITEAYENSLKAAESYPNTLVNQLALVFRYHPAVLRASELLRRQVLGDVLQCKIAYLRSGYLSSERPFSWRLSDSLSGGGAITDIGVHALDLICHWFGELKKVHGVTETFITERRAAAAATAEMVPIKVDDWAAVHFQTHSGVKGLVEVSRIAWGSDAFQVQIVGSRGSMVFDLEKDSAPTVSLIKGSMLEAVEPSTLELLPDAKATMGLFTDTHFAALHHFLLRLHNEDRWEGLAPELDDGLRVEKYIHHILTGKSI